MSFLLTSGAHVIPEHQPHPLNFANYLKDAKASAPPLPHLQASLIFKVGTLSCLINLPCTVHTFGLSCRFCKNCRGNNSRARRQIEQTSSKRAPRNEQ